jgi:glycosidase
VHALWRDFLGFRRWHADKIAWRILEKSVAPGVVVAARGSDARTYTIAATLGDRPITITVPVHDD